MRRLTVWYGGLALFALLFAATTPTADSTSNAPAILTAWTGIKAGLLFGAVYGVYAVFRVALFQARSIRELKTVLQAEYGRILERVVGAAWVLACATSIFNVFVNWKVFIGSTRPYSWDPLLAQIDSLMHFGTDPWRISLVLFRPLTPFLDALYLAWYVVKLNAFILFSAFRPIRERAHFFWAVCLMYLVGGTVLAHLFASGGPAFFEELTGDADRFKELWPFLEGTQAVLLQDQLWQGYLHPDAALPFSGISAMPSVHVAFASILAFWGWETNRWAGAVTTGYAILVFVGSVHLGWHYAIDGYAGALVAWASWISARWIVASGLAPEGPHLESSPPTEPE